MNSFLRKLTKFLLLVFVILAAAITLIVIQQIRNAREEVSIEGIQQRDGIPVQVVYPQQRDFTDYLHVDGTVTADRRAVLRARISEEVKRVYADTGERVKKGQILVEFRTKDLEATVDARTAAAEEAQQNYERYQALHEDGHVTKQALEQKRTAIENARAALRQAESRMAFTKVRAPMTGRLEQRDVDPGEFKSTGNLLLTILDLSTVVISADVPGSAMWWVDVGAAAEFRLADRSEWNGTAVTRIRPSTENPNRFFDVFMTIDNRRAGGDGGPRLLHPGMYAEVRLPRKTEKNAIAVPESTVRQQGSEYYVFVVREAQEERPVAPDAAKNKEQKPEGAIATVVWALKNYARQFIGAEEEDTAAQIEMQEVDVLQLERLDVEIGMREGRFVQLRAPEFEKDTPFVVNPTDDLRTGRNVDVQSKQEVDR